MGVVSFLNIPVYNMTIGFYWFYGENEIETLV
jgi:hypothetical protein